MSDPVSLASLFDAAEQAALRGDFAAASRFLGEAARAQEAALGANHLDLANTLNNLAVAHERCGQLDAAEREYRRAFAIAERALPADDPLVTTSAQNLREFCEAHGRPLELTPSPLSLADVVPEPAAMPARAPRPGPVDTPTVPIEPLAITFAAPSPQAPPPPVAPAQPAARPAEPPRPAPTRPAPARPASAPPAPSTPAPSRPAPTPVAAPRVSETRSQPAPAAPLAPAPGRRVSIPMLVALGAIAAIVIWALTGRRVSAPPAAVPAAAPTASAPSPGVSQTPAPAAPSRSASAPAEAGSRRAPSAPVVVDGLTVADAQLCTSLSASYRCDAAGARVRPGRLVFYTRLVAARNTSVVHRWYRGNEVRQSVRLEVPARRQGFRTFSRTTVAASDGEWRVELRSADGKILHTERFTVR